MADNSVFITGVAEGVFKDAFEELPGWATQKTAEDIEGVLRKTLQLQTKAFSNMANSSAGGLKPADLKKFKDEIDNAIHALEEQNKQIPKRKKWWKDRETEEDKQKKRWREVQKEHAGTIAALSVMAAMGNNIKQVFMDNVNTFDTLNKAGINVISGMNDAANGFEAMQQLTAITGVRFTELSPSMQKFSTAINAFGTGKFAKTVGKSVTELAQFGYSSKEAADLLGEYLSVQQGYANANSKTFEETTDDLIKFAGNINKLSLATGQSRAAILANL